MQPSLSTLPYRPKRFLPKGLLSFSDLREYRRNGQNLLLIRLYNWGEPLLNKELIKMVEYANEHRIAVKISTNLSLPIENAQAEALINANLQKIYIFCDGASGSTYPSIILMEILTELYQI